MGMFGALQAWCAEGFRGLVSYVEANIFVWKVLGKHRIHVDRSCRSLGIDLLRRE